MHPAAVTGVTLGAATDNAAPSVGHWPIWQPTHLGGNLGRAETARKGLCPQGLGITAPPPWTTRAGL
jgi:hypothetical protein